LAVNLRLDGARATDEAAAAAATRILQSNLEEKLSTFWPSLGTKTKFPAG